MLRYTLNILILGLLTTSNLFAQSVENVMAEANKNYTDGKFEDAINAYESITKKGYMSDKLFFNLGNAYFKTKNYPSAILNYERAILIKPGDENILFNLDLAKTYTVDRIEPLPEFFMATFFNKIRQFMSTDGWAYTGLLFLIISLGLAYFFWFSFNPNLKRITFSIGIVTLVITLVSFTFSTQQKNNILDHNYGILFPSVVAVKSSPGDSGKDLFVLHAGTKVKIIDSVGDWLEVRIADGNQGWILKDTLERI